jgi:hypothetical protein
MNNWKGEESFAIYWASKLRGVYEALPTSGVKSRLCRKADRASWYFVMARPLDPCYQPWTEDGGQRLETELRVLGGAGSAVRLSAVSCGGESTFRIAKEKIGLNGECSLLSPLSLSL